MVSNSGNGGNRSVITSIAGLAIVGLALFFLIRDLSTVDSAYRHSATDAAVKYERDAEAYIKERCLSPTRFGEPDCATKAREAAREGQRKEQDLAAQNITAWWTKVMGVAALIGMALSAVGVWLVKTTFDETRKANDIAKDHQRARLMPSAELMRAHYLSETMKVALRCENIGLSPAYRVRCFTLPVKDIPEKPPTDAIGGFERIMTVGSTEDLVEVGNFEHDHYIVGMIQYDTIFGGTKYSYFCFCFVWSQTNKKWFAVSQIPSTWPHDT